MMRLCVRHAKAFAPPMRSAGSTFNFSSSPQESDHPSVAIIGVGQMGAALACNLLRHGVETTLFDLCKDQNIPDELRAELVDANWAKSAAEATAGAEVVITALPRPEHVTEAMESEGGILEGFRAGTTWVEHSTTDFENTIRVKSLVEAKGGFAVEAPLTGGMQILREGKMVVSGTRTGYKSAQKSWTQWVNKNAFLF